MLGGSEADTAGYRDEYTLLTAAEAPAIAKHAEQMAFFTATDHLRLPVISPR